MLNAFLTHGFPIDLRNEQSYTALMVAAYHGQSAAVKLLLQHGANACLEDKRGNTALMGALVKAELAIAKTLYDQACDLNHSNKAGLTIREFAAMFGQSAALATLAQPNNQ